MNIKTKNVIEYKGYHTLPVFDSEDCVLRGKIEGIKDLVTYECESASQVAQEFENAVDEYLAFCEEVGKNPEKEYNGSFNIRISSDLHRRMANAASKRDVSLNSLIGEAIQEYLHSIDE